jgi:hypothetical protein
MELIPLDKSGVIKARSELCFWPFLFLGILTYDEKGMGKVLS